MHLNFKILPDSLFYWSKYHSQVPTDILTKYHIYHCWVRPVQETTLHWAKNTGHSSIPIDFLSVQNVFQTALLLLEVRKMGFKQDSTLENYCTPLLLYQNTAEKNCSVPYVWSKLAVKNTRTTHWHPHHLTQHSSTTPSSQELISHSLTGTEKAYSGTESVREKVLM